ncbi:MAG: hypothetical protein HY720_01040 [Planctomycetes bacterium]|nr:hypothetical protein [Planctomycetota bacterium]
MQFNAGVQPFFHLTKEEAEIWGEEKSQEKRRAREEIVREIKKAIHLETGVEDIGVEEDTGDCACKFMVDRAGMLIELQEFAIGLDEAETEAVYRGEQQTRFNHLIEIKDGVGFYLPVYFFFPIWVQTKALVYPLFVGSAPRLLEELLLVNEKLDIEKSAKLARMPDYLMADEEQIEDYEYAFGSEDNFWERFAFVLLKKLSEKSIEKKMPVIIDV